MFYIPTASTVAQKTVPMFGHFAKISLYYHIYLIHYHKINICNTIIMASKQALGHVIWIRIGGVIK